MADTLTGVGVTRSKGDSTGVTADPDKLNWFDGLGGGCGWSAGDDVRVRLG